MSNSLGHIFLFVPMEKDIGKMNFFLVCCWWWIGTLGYIMQNKKIIQQTREGIMKKYYKLCKIEVLFLIMYINPKSDS
jgi:hypothetical protein